MEWTIFVDGVPLRPIVAAANEFPVAKRVSQGPVDVSSSVEGYFDTYAENGNCALSPASNSNIGSFTFLGVTFPTDSCGWDAQACEDCIIFVKIGEETVTDCTATTNWSGSTSTVPVSSKLYESIVSQLGSDVNIGEVTVTGTPINRMTATCTLLVV